jgi:hypothetical protein
VHRAIKREFSRAKKCNLLFLSSLFPVPFSESNRTFRCITKPRRIPHNTHVVQGC